jgi:hypothetical protein
VSLAKFHGAFLGANTALSDNDDKSDAGLRTIPWGWIASVAVIVVAVASQSETETATSPATQSDSLVSDTRTSGAPLLVMEAAVAEITLKTAARHAGLALGADGIDGATAYSVNCWASLERAFSLATTERCAAFDALILSNADVDPSVMPQWFAETTVASRYQVALSNSGAAVADIPDRLERLRVATALQTVSLVKAKSKKPLAPTVIEGDVEAPDGQAPPGSLTIENARSEDE